jgi:hypothetical protein
VRTKGKESEEKAKKFVRVLCAAKQAELETLTGSHGNQLQPV